MLPDRITIVAVEAAQVIEFSEALPPAVWTVAAAVPRAIDTALVAVRA